MSTFAWIANGLKGLRLTAAPALQSRLAGTQASGSGPQKPKRPLTPYFRFLGQVREEVAKANPNMKPTEIMKMIGQRWEKLDSQKKEKYAEGFREEMDSYKTLAEKYYKSLSTEDRETQHKIKIDRQLSKEKRDKKKRLRELGKPKKPASPFLQFLQSKIPPGSGIEVHKTAAKEMAPVWKNMSDAEKGPWTSKYHDELEQYNKTLVKWEELMIKQGNDDVVRVQRLNKSSQAKAK